MRYLLHAAIAGTARVKATQANALRVVKHFVGFCARRAAIQCCEMGRIDPARRIILAHEIDVGVRRDFLGHETHDRLGILDAARHDQVAHQHAALGKAVPGP